MADQRVAQELQKAMADRIKAMDAAMRECVEAMNKWGSAYDRWRNARANEKGGGGR